MKTAIANQVHVAIFGKTNSGKSELFNTLVEAKIALVTDIKGTTTDPIFKSVEFLPYGPVVFIDTAGFGDLTKLADARESKTLEVLEKTDFAIYLIDKNDSKDEDFERIEKEFIKREIPYIIVYSKVDLLNHKDETGFEGIKISSKDNDSIKNLRKIIIENLNELKDLEKTLLDGLDDKLSEIAIIIKVDSAAPKGRLILPQVQTIRDCVDKNIICHVLNLNNLESFLNKNKVDLIITDAQIFAEVNEKIKDEKLTAFSILMARQKGDLKELYNAIKAIKTLKDGDKVLIAEACHHSKGHEDIGTIKIPALLKKISGKNLEFDFVHGSNFINNIEDYKLIVHCAACMINRKNFINRIRYAKSKNVPITNYGMFLAYANDMLEKSMEIFLDEV